MHGFTPLKFQPLMGEMLRKPVRQGSHWGSQLYIHRAQATSQTGGTHWATLGQSTVYTESTDNQSDRGHTLGHTGAVNCTYREHRQPVRQGAHSGAHWASQLYIQRAQTTIQRANRGAVNCTFRRHRQQVRQSNLCCIYMEMLKVNCYVGPWRLCCHLAKALKLSYSRVSHWRKSSDSVKLAAILEVHCVVFGVDSEAYTEHGPVVTSIPQGRYIVDPFLHYVS